MRKIFDDVLFFNGTCGRDNQMDDSIIGESKCIFIFLLSMSNVGARKKNTSFTMARDVDYLVFDDFELLELVVFEDVAIGGFLGIHRRRLGGGSGR